MVTGESIPVTKGEGDIVVRRRSTKPGRFRFRATNVGQDTMLAQIIRLVEQAQGSKAPIQRLADKVSSYFVADTGDGWDSTYSVAYQVGQPQLDLPGIDGPIPRGDVLVFGGDQVYPVANRQSYRERLVEPYEAALPETNPPNPHVFAVPGNHDWYDSLVSFTRLFCSRRWFGGWKTRQSRSYFALKLPHRWWLVGVDVQLDSDIDIPQVKFFKRIARRMGEGDRIICVQPSRTGFSPRYTRNSTPRLTRTI